MKKQIIVTSLLSTVSVSLGIFVGLKSRNQKDTYKVEAYDSTTTLPTTIDLKDNTASEIRNYYSSLNSLVESERRGTNLLKNLKPILANNQVYYSYDYSYGTVVWQLYEIVDRDWEKSPATELGSYGTYNPSTNKITNYQYGTSNSNSKSNPYLHALYVNRNVDNQARAWGDHTQNGWGINREHVWAKSHGMGSDDDSSTSGGARGDIMHLWSGNGYVNGFDYHGNLFYGFVNKNSSYSDAGNTQSYLSGNLKGYSATFGSGTVFEPQDSDKGDIARICFYMAARYNYLSGSDSDGIDANNPWLTLYDGTSDPNGSSSYDSTTSTQGYMGVLRDLLAWNRLDPPDEWEIHRNNLLFNNYTHNRNPFVDFPEWAEYIWGTSTLAGDNRRVTSYNSSPTGYATPSSDTINDFYTGGTVDVTGVSVTPTSTTLNAGGTQQLTVSVLPNNATDTSVSYSSNNTGVATVSNSGLITAVSAGNATVTVTTNDGGFTATCQVTVNAPVVPSSDFSLTSGSPYINGVPYKMYFYSTNKSANYYFAGEMNGYYGKTTTSIAGATDVYFEERNDGQNIYFYVSEVKNYLSVTVNGSYNNFTFSTSVPDYPWYYLTSGSDYSCMTYTVDAKILTFGTYGTYTTFGGVDLTSYTNNYEVEFVSSNDSSATALSEILTDDIVCNPTGASAPTYVSGITWDSFEKAYDELNDTAKNILLSTNSNPNGNSLEKGLAKYDYILGKYNTSSTTPYNDFLGRINGGKITLSVRNRFASSFNRQQIFLVIAICGAASFISLAIFMSLRKKRRIK